MKLGSVRCPNMYLGKNLKHKQLHNVIWAWSMSTSKYAQEAVRIYEVYTAKCLSKGYKLPRRSENLLESCYCHDLDVSPVLGPDETFLMITCKE